MNTTYAQRVKSNPQTNTFYPKKEQSIILNALPNIPINNYILAVANIIDPTKITYAAKMSNNRICICLKTKEDADYITNNHKSIIINNQNVIIRKYLAPAHRLIIWIFPSIPNEFIIDLLKTKGIKPVSDMFFMSAGIKDQRLSHVKSFHRYIYISDDHPAIPEITTITYENEPYKTYFTIEEKQCRNCNKFGHETENCNKIDIPPTLTPIETSRGPNITIEDSQEIGTQEESLTIPTQPTNNQQNSIPTITDTQSINCTQEPDIIEDISQNTPATINIAEEDTLEANYSNQEFKLPTEKTRRRQRSSETNSEEEHPHKHLAVEPESEESGDSSIESDNLTQELQAEPNQILIDKIQHLQKPMDNEPQKYFFGYDMLKNIILESKENQNINNILQKYQLNPEHTINTLETIKPMLKEPQIKARFTRLIKKIKKIKRSSHL